MEPLNDYIMTFMRHNYFFCISGDAVFRVLVKTQATIESDLENNNHEG